VTKEKYRTHNVSKWLTGSKGTMNEAIFVRIMILHNKTEGQMIISFQEHS